MTFCTRVVQFSYTLRPGCRVRAGGGGSLRADGFDEFHLDEEARARLLAIVFDGLADPAQPPTGLAHY